MPVSNTAFKAVRPPPRTHNEQHVPRCSHPDGAVRARTAIQRRRDTGHDEHDRLHARLGDRVVRLGLLHRGTQRARNCQWVVDTVVGALFLSYFMRGLRGGLVVCSLESLVSSAVPFSSWTGTDGINIECASGRIFLSLLLLDRKNLPSVASNSLDRWSQNSRCRSTFLHTFLLTHSNTGFYLQPIYSAASTPHGTAPATQLLTWQSSSRRM